MAIVSFIEITGDTASRDREGKQEQGRRFKIQTDTTLAPVATAEAMLGLALRARPDLAPFAAHPDSARSFVTEPRATRESRWVWTLEVPYSSEIDVAEFEAKELKPEDRDPTQSKVQVTVSGWRKTVIITSDVEGNPIANTAGDPFPDVEDELHSLELNVSAKVSKIEPEWLLEYPNSVNQEEMKFLGIRFPAKTLLMSDPNVGNEEIENNIRYLPFSYKLTYQKDGWLNKRLNTGYRELRPGSVRIQSKLAKITDQQGEPIDEPVFLDERGRAYRVGVDATKQVFTDSDFKQPLRADLEPSEIIELEFEVKRTLPFKKLPYR